MTLAQLSYIVAVDTHRHFVQAAEHCGISQPTLSMQIRKLERELGAKLRVDEYREELRLRESRLVRGG